MKKNDMAERKMLLELMPEPNDEGTSIEEQVPESPVRFVDEQNATEDDDFDVHPLDSRIAFMVFNNPAISDQQLADELGLCRQTVNRRRKNENVQKAIRDTLQLHEGEMRRLAAKAFRNLEQLLDSDDARISLAASLALVKLAPPLVSIFPHWTNRTF